MTKAIGEARCDRAKERMGAYLMREDQVAEQILLVSGHTCILRMFST